MIDPRSALLLAALALSGCLTAAPAPPPAATQAEPEEPQASTSAAAEAPDLPLGRAWTYGAFGEWDAESTFTVVVAERSASGYLLAAAREEDLPTQVAWGRPWFGRRDAELNVVRSEHATEVDRLFDFPLEDGKSWPSSAGVVRARAAELSTPLGASPGFVMDVVSGDAVIRWEYAPDVGFLTRYRHTVGERVLVDAVLESVGESAAWVWYEPGPAVEVESTATGGLDVPPGMHAVVGNAGGYGRAVALVQPPEAAGPFAYEAGAAYGNVPFSLTATPGPWRLSAAAAPDAYVYVRAVAVTWVRSG